MKYSNRHISDDELDQLFRDAHASEGQESLFVPEFWSEMEAILPPVEKNRSLVPWTFVAATFAIALILIFYPSTAPRISNLTQQSAINSAPNHSLENKNTELAHHIDSNKEVSNESEIENTPSVSNSNGVVRLKKTPFNRNQKPVRNVPPTKDLLVVHEQVIPVETLANDSLNNNQNSTNQEDDLSFQKLAMIGLEVHGSDPLISSRMLGKPNNASQNENEWYVELGPTLGQSPYMSKDQKRNIVGGAVLGGGYSLKMDQTFVSFGLQARLEGFGGLEYRETNFSPNIVRTVSVKELYSLEMPLRFGYQLGRSEILFGVTPGLQLFVHGKEQITENQVVQRTGSYTGKVEHSSSMSMEFGLQYYYRLSPNYSIGAKINADVLRPFHTDYYLGKLTGFPVNGQIVLRRSFTKKVR
jgi:hypothetical protein